MRILLDHCLPRRLIRSFPAHYVQTVADMGWERLRNGNLLVVAALQFDVFLTIDKKIRREQNLAALPIAVIVIMAVTNRMEELAPFVTSIAAALDQLQPRSYVELTASR